jgi:hypothetical protein
MCSSGPSDRPGDMRTVLAAMVGASSEALRRSSRPRWAGSGNRADRPSPGPAAPHDGYSTTGAMRLRVRCVSGWPTPATRVPHLPSRSGPASPAVRHGRLPRDPFLHRRSRHSAGVCGRLRFLVASAFARRRSSVRTRHPPLRCQQDNACRDHGVFSRFRRFRRGIADRLP